MKTPPGVFEPRPLRRVRFWVRFSPKIEKTAPRGSSRSRPIPRIFTNLAKSGASRPGSQSRCATELRHAPIQPAALGLQPAASSGQGNLGHVSRTNQVLDQVVADGRQPAGHRQGRPERPRSKPPSNRNLCPSFFSLPLPEPAIRLDTRTPTSRSALGPPTQPNQFPQTPVADPDPTTIVHPSSQFRC
jgi:hypothetical protein